MPCSRCQALLRADQALRAIVRGRDVRLAAGGSALHLTAAASMLHFVQFVSNPGFAQTVWVPRTALVEHIANNASCITADAVRRRSRLDRCFAKLADWCPDDVEMVGTRPLGPIWMKPLKARPVPQQTLPSDHYGVLTTLRPVCARAE